MEDRRGRTARRGMGAPVKLTGGVGVIIVLAVLLLGGDPTQLLQMSEQAPIETGSPAGAPPEDDAEAQFISTMLASTEDVWSAQFAQAGATYRQPRLVLFSGAVNSACGYNTAATGPFYCPPDQQIYIDLTFFRELARMGGPGDFARAYVLGHEVGHHIQQLTGISDQVRQQQRAVGEADANALQVRMELQADCLAGVVGPPRQPDPPDPRARRRGGGPGGGGGDRRRQADEGTRDGACPRSLSLTARRGSAAIGSSGGCARAMPTSATRSADEPSGARSRTRLVASVLPTPTG